MAKHSKSERESEWFQYGTDKEYQAFCRTLPCAITGKTNRIVYAHYRTAQNSGTAFKPPFSGIPLEYHEHLRQHQIGQFAFLPKERWEMLCRKYLEMWKNSVLKNKR